MAGERDMGDATRNQMMQNLFGEQSEEEDEEEVDSEGAAADANHSDYHSEEGEGEAENDGEGEVEGQGEVEAESEAEAEAHDIDHDQAESEGERPQSSEREISDQKMDSEPKDVESEEEEEEEEEDYGHRVATSRRRDVVASESEGSQENHYRDHEDDEAESDQPMKPRSVDEQKDQEVVRDVFGESDEEEPAEYGAQEEIEHDSHEEDNYEKDLRPEDIVPNEDARYMSEDDQFEEKPKEKPVGPPLHLDVPWRPPPAQADRMNVIKVSNIMGIEPKPFDRKTYVEEDVFVTDESGTKKRIRLEDNIVRWRTVKNRDGSSSYESNARFVRWSDGSLQLLIGNEVLDISVHDAHHDQSHLFLRHGKGILQSQGRLLQKMRFMPSSLSSKSHRLLTALVDSRHKKVYKVKNCITDIDPEREKEEKEKVEGQTIRANVLLQKKKEKVNRKFGQTTTRRERQISPGFLEDALDEEDEHEDYRPSRNRYDEVMEAETKAEKRRMMNAKKPSFLANKQHKSSSARLSRPPVDEYSGSDKESEYETDEDDERPQLHPSDDEPEYVSTSEEEAGEEAGGANSASEEDEEPRKKTKDIGSSSHKRKEIDSDDNSPPKKLQGRRKTIVMDSDEDD